MIPIALPYLCTASATCIAKLAGGNQDQRAEPVRGLGFRSEDVEQRQRESRGFAGAGRGLGEHVATREQGWDRFPRLD